MLPSIQCEHSLKQEDIRLSKKVVYKEPTLVENKWKVIAEADH